MAYAFEDIQKIGKENVDFALKSVDAVTRGWQAIAAEAADYSRRSFEAGSAAIEKLLASKSLDRAVEVQSEFVRSAYEGYVGQVTKVGEIVSDMARGAYKPYESFLGKAAK